MDTDARTMVIRLCTQAGIVMEDASPVAITLASATDDQCVAACQRLLRDAEQIRRLVAAACVVMDG